MSYVALATDRFEAVTRFYGEQLAFRVTSEWDRPTGRGKRFDLGGGLRLEILDNQRERSPMNLCEARDRIHVVVEVPDIDAAHGEVHSVVPAPAAQDASWGARLFQIRDPDGVPVTFLQWDTPGQDGA